MSNDTFLTGVKLVCKDDPKRVWVVKVHTSCGVAIEADNGAIRYVLCKDYDQYSIYTP